MNRSVNAVFSPSSGLLFFPDKLAEEGVLVSLRQKTLVDVSSVRNELALAPDWQSIVAENEKDAVSTAQDKASIEYARTLIQSCTKINSEETLQWGISEVEQVLSSGIDLSRVLSRLLIAPIAEQKSWEALREKGVLFGCPTVVSLVGELVELQPPLRRLADLWLSLPGGDFSYIGETRYEFWHRLVKEGCLSDLVKAGKKDDVNKVFVYLMMQESSAQVRKGITALSNRLTDYLFSAANPEEWEDEDVENGYPQDEVVHETVEPGRDVLKQVQAQIDGIVREVSDGRDGNAYRYLDELIDFQKGNSDNEQIVKSLCNIAKKAANLFRSDFERYCLETGMKIDPDDSWLLNQLGDHFKRIGDYEKAIHYLEKAKQSDDNFYVSVSSLANVYAEKGDLDTAISIYKSIPGWEGMELVRNGIADALRKEGEFAKAEREYRRIEDALLRSHRTDVGIAEIRKREGKINEAIKIYRNVLENESLDYLAQLVYRHALAGLFKQRGDLQAAYEITSEIIKEEPFHVGSRLLMASILSLMKKHEEANLYLPSDSVKPRASDEWTSVYIRGLLMMQEHDFSRARNGLLDNLNAAFLENETRDVLRMAAVVSYFAEGAFDDGVYIIDEIGDLKNKYLSYMKSVLEYHYAVYKENEELAAELYDKLLEDKDMSDRLWLLVETVRNKTGKLVVEMEVDALLGYAS